MLKVNSSAAEIEFGLREVQEEVGPRMRMRKELQLIPQISEANQC